MARKGALEPPYQIPQPVVRSQTYLGLAADREALLCSSHVFMFYYDIGNDNNASNKSYDPRPTHGRPPRACLRSSPVSHACAACCVSRRLEQTPVKLILAAIICPRVRS